MYPLCSSGVARGGVALNARSTVLLGSSTALASSRPPVRSCSALVATSSGALCGSRLGPGAVARAAEGRVVRVVGARREHAVHAPQPLLRGGRGIDVVRREGSRMAAQES